MAEKIIKTKIALRWLDYGTWSTEAFKAEKPLKGEVWFCEVPTGNANAQTAPTMLFKVGDGVNTFGTLKWASALAADVYGWAKKEHLDVNDLPTLPIEVIDNENGKFVTGFEYANNTLTIHRADAVNSLAANDDDVVILSVDKSTGDVTVTGEHAKKGPANGYTGGQATDEINAFGDSITIKVPKLSVDAYGHTNAAEDVEYKITLPTPEAATNTVTTLEEGDGIDIEELATDGNHRYKISHEDTSDVANVTKEARKYVAGVTFDDFGHVTAVEMGEEVDQDLSGYKTTQAAVAAQNLSGAKVIKSVSQNEQGVITVDTRDLTAADLGLDTVMHFIGAYAAAPAKAFAGTGNERDLANGDVYLNTANATEYVYSNGKWVELGNEEGAGSHALKTVTVTGIGYLTGGGDLSANRTIDISDEAKTKIDKAHSHANKEELDKIADGDVAKWTEAYNKRHEHSNKELLDTYTQTEANLADAVDKKHAHGNKELLDTYDQTNENIKAAINAKHEHANKNELDLFVAGDKAKLDSALQGIDADTGLKVVEGTVNKIAIDTDVVFVLDCNW